MTFDKEGRYVEVYDYVSADSVVVGDQILIDNDPIEVEEITDETDTIMIRGYSHLTGDSVVYMLNPDKEVGLWTV